MQMLKRTRPESLDDLTVQVALVRPGPILGGAVHPYIERRKRLREDPSYEVPYDHPALEPVLRDTLGAIVFQDQVLEVSMAFAGFSAGEAEGLRRAMSRKRSEAAIRAYEEKFIAGAGRNGASREVAERVWAQIVGFSGFGFPKAHSAAFGLLAYQSTWLRVHYAGARIAAARPRGVAAVGAGKPSGVLGRARRSRARRSYGPRIRERRPHRGDQCACRGARPGRSVPIGRGHGRPVRRFGGDARAACVGRRV
jgi:hypothetical protein